VKSEELEIVLSSFFILHARNPNSSLFTFHFSLFTFHLIMPANHVLPSHVHHYPHGGIPPHHGPPTHHDKLVKNAKKLVSQTFFGTMLKQMHNSPFKSKLFSGGRGGEAFGSLLDQHLADRMASGAGGRLVDSMVNRWEHPRQPPHSPAMDAAAAKQRALEEGIKRGGYRQPPAVQWRQNVSADLRA
jgi:hypothetical protein